AGLPDLAGEGSAAERARRLGELFGRATAAERSFLARWLVGELRQGALEGVLTEAVAMAAGVEAAAVREVLMVEGDLAVVGEQALRDGGAGLAGRAIQLFRPVLPMLAGTASSPAEALERFGEVAVEAKLDGVRIQVHKSGERIEVYSRQRKPLTGAPHGGPERPRPVPRTDPRGGSRRAAPQVAGRSLSGRPPRHRVAQVEAGGDARPGRAGRGVGARAAARLAQQPAPGRPRPGERRLRHDRQDLQGAQRRDARLADGAAPRPRALARGVDGPRRARARR